MIFHLPARHFDPALIVVLVVLAVGIVALGLLSERSKND